MPSALPDSTLDFISHYWQCIDWSELFRYSSLPDHIIETHHTQFNWPVILRYQRLGTTLLTKFITALQYARLHPNEQLPDSGIQVDLSDHWICWEFISEYQVLNEELVKKYADQLNWKWVTLNLRTNSYHTLGNTQFLVKYHELLDWNDISRFYPLTEDDARAMSSYLVFDYLLRLSYHNLSQDHSDFDTDYDYDCDYSEDDISVLSLVEQFRVRNDTSRFLRSANVLVSTQFIRENRDRFTVFNPATVNPGQCELIQRTSNRAVRYLRVLFAMNMFRARWKRRAYAIGGVMYLRIAKHYDQLVIEQSGSLH